MIHFLLAICALPALAIDNGLNEKPAMGWSALYGAPFATVNETMMVVAAQALNESGLLAFGYDRVNLDDWYAIRDGQNGKIKAKPTTFPSGMPAVSDKIHAAGVKFGVYSAASMRTCANYSASLFNEVNDANTFAHEWKIDMLKYDACRYNSGVGSRARYSAMGKALNATGRQILYSVEGWNPGSDGTWGPHIANSWRTGSDIWPHWDNSNVCILNNLYQTNYAAKFHIVGQGFNDPDMLQPPNTLITVLSPGLAPEEAYSQFKLWVIMKSPLVLGTHWTQIANLKTLEPKYFGLLTNTEMLAINHDPSPQAIVVRQFPSKAQQNNNGAAGPRIPVSFSVCDEKRASQRFVPGPTPGTIQLKDTNLCVNQNGTAVSLYSCSANSQVWGLQNDGLNVHLGTVGSSGQCLTGSPRTYAPQLQKCIYTGPLPPASVFQANFGFQAFVWETTTSNIISAGNSMCLTAGLPNYDPEDTTHWTGQWITNNGTLEHEVWMGDLTPANGNARRVVALFNKGISTEQVFAPADLYTRELGLPAGSKVAVRDVVNKQDVTVAPGAPIVADVPRHGVAVFVVTFG